MSSSRPGFVPYFLVEDGAAAAAFYTRVFGAEQEFLRPSTSGGVAHATMKTPSGTIMLSDDPDWGKWGHLGKGLGWLAIYVDDVDVVVDEAVKAGAVIDVAPYNTPWGDRYARFRDPFGQMWALSGTAKPG